MAELLIRPSRNDHGVIQDLLAPRLDAMLMPASRPLLDRLVLDAPVAAVRPEFADAARAAGVPILVDPLTILWQGTLRENDGWAKLPFGQPEKLGVDVLRNHFAMEKMVAETVEFQIQHGATAIIPPYLYSKSPSDPCFEICLDLLRLTSRYMRQNGISLPVVPVFCGQLKGFGAESAWEQGIDRFSNVALDLGPEALAVCLSPLGSVQGDAYSKVLRLFASALRVKRSGVRVIAWRQGVFGPGLVAAGIDGYECGIGMREKADLAAAVSSRKPPPPGKKPKGGAAPGIYLEPLKRSVTSPVGEVLLGHRSMRPKVMCDDDRCCPDGAASTLDQRRHHAVRARSRDLALLEGQPHKSWQLHQIAKDARSAAALAEQANLILKEAGIRERLGTKGYESLADVADFLRLTSEESQAA